MTDRKLWLTAKVNALLDELGDNSDAIAKRLNRDDIVGSLDDEYDTVVGNWIADKFFIEPISVRVHENSIKISEDGLSISSKLPDAVLLFLEAWREGDWPELLRDGHEYQVEEYYDR